MKNFWGDRLHETVTTFPHQCFSSASSWQEVPITSFFPNHLYTKGVMKINSFFIAFSSNVAQICHCRHRHPLIWLVWKRPPFKIAAHTGHRKFMVTIHKFLRRWGSQLQGLGQLLSAMFACGAVALKAACQLDLWGFVWQLSWCHRCVGSSVVQLHDRTLEVMWKCLGLSSFPK